MRRKKTAEDFALDSINYLVLGMVCLLTIYPFYYVIVLSFNDGLDAAQGGIYWWPRDFTLDNFRYFLSEPRWLNGIGISVARTVVGTLLSVLFTCLVAYGLAYRKLLLRPLYYTILIVSMYFSGGIIPYYVVLKQLGLLNTFGVYVIPGALNVFFVLVAVAFFRELPAEIEESAHLDGANELQTFYRIVLPLSKPILATMGLFVGVGHWNSWLDSAYFIQDDRLRTMSYLMMEVINKSIMNASSTSSSFASASASVTGPSLQMTAMTIAVLPIMLVYPFLQKHFVKGIMVGAVKG